MCVNKPDERRKVNTRKAEGQEHYPNTNGPIWAADNYLKISYRLKIMYGNNEVITHIFVISSGPHVKEAEGKLVLAAVRLRVAQITRLLLVGIKLLL